MNFNTDIMGDSVYFRSVDGLSQKLCCLRRLGQIGTPWGVVGVSAIEHQTIKHVRIIIGGQSLNRLVVQRREPVCLPFVPASVVNTASGDRTSAF